MATLHLIKCSIQPPAANSAADKLLDPATCQVDKLDAVLSLLLLLRKTQCQFCQKRHRFHAFILHSNRWSRVDIHVVGVVGLRLRSVQGIQTRPNLIPVDKDFKCILECLDKALITILDQLLDVRVLDGVHERLGLIRSLEDRAEVSRLDVELFGLGIKPRIDKLDRGGDSWQGMQAESRIDQLACSSKVAHAQDRCHGGKPTMVVGSHLHKLPMLQVRQNDCTVPSTMCHQIRVIGNDNDRLVTNLDRRMQHVVGAAVVDQLEAQVAKLAIHMEADGVAAAKGCHELLKGRLDDGFPAVNGVGHADGGCCD
ncbi:hypothetical protein BC831DRAFT_491641 [Entophlyctis helioformis]|nr:hypothetical protein BC831DRAFT_491641 [Entophlyctis helioformis]